MTATARFPGFYRGAINLWVEDVLTRDYLRKVWKDDPAIVFYVGGHTDSVGAILREAETAGLTNVFAYVDRDFGVSNRPSWNNPATGRRLVTSVHEAENHLLDVDALAGCALNSGRRASAEIQARLMQRAEELCWMMAGRRVIFEAKQQTLLNFPAHPTCPPVIDQASAEAYILGLPWWGQVAAYAPTLTIPYLQGRLAAHHVTAADWIAGGQWIVEFSGKELYRHVRGWVYAKPPVAGSPTMHDADLAKAVGEWQAANNRVPTELTELLTALKSRTGAQ